MTNRLLGLPYSFPSWVTALGRVFQLAVMNGRPQRRHKNQVAELQSPVGWNFVPRPVGHLYVKRTFDLTCRNCLAGVELCNLLAPNEWVLPQLTKCQSSGRNVLKDTGNNSRKPVLLSNLRLSAQSVRGSSSSSTVVRTSLP